MRRRVVITGSGWITPLGQTIEGVWKRMLAGDTGIDRVTLFDASAYPANFGAEVKDFRLEDYLGDHAAVHAGCSRNTAFALAAAKIAFEYSGLHKSGAVDPDRIGIYLGGGEGPIDFWPFAEAALAGVRKDDGSYGSLDTVRWAKTALKVLSARNELEQDPNLAASHLAKHFKARGPNFNTLTACAASTQAIGQATGLIRYGDADVMITGGTHSMLHQFGMTGFIRLTALSTRNDEYKTASRPFDRTRDGFVLGEGSGIVILEELEHAKRRGAPILAEVLGFGSTADAFRITDIHEDGRGAIAAMTMALADAGVKREEIDYISAHGTSTEENDKIETLAIRQVFGGIGTCPPVSSVKSMLGHLIAAAGVVEMITCLLAIRDGMLPPTINYQNADPNCDLDYVPNEARPKPVRTALSNSFGFGGQNDTLVVRAYEE